MDGHEVFHHKKAAGVIYQAALRAELTAALPVAFGPVSENGQAEIAGRHQVEIERGEQVAKLGELALVVGGKHQPAGGKLAGLAGWCRAAHWPMAWRWAAKSWLVPCRARARSSSSWASEKGAPSAVP